MRPCFGSTPHPSILRAKSYPTGAAPDVPLYSSGSHFSKKHCQFRHAAALDDGGQQLVGNRKFHWRLRWSLSFPVLPLGGLPRERQSIKAAGPSVIVSYVFRRTPAHHSRRCPQGISSSLPVVARPSSWRWASAASFSANLSCRCSLSLPERTQPRTSSERCSSSSRVAV